MPTTIDLETLMRGLTNLATGQQALIPDRKEASLTESTLGLLNGCCGLFQPCGDNELLGLTLESDKFMDWLRFVANDECKQFVRMLSYSGPAGAAAGTEATGAIAACADAPGVEFGTCEVLLPDKGRIARAGPVRDLTENNRKVCDSFPLFTKRGEQIQDELAWGLTMAGTALRQDLKKLIITGNAASTGEFAGLEALVNTGYQNAQDGRLCSAMDSFVLDWGSQVMTYLRNSRFNLVHYIIDIVRRIRTRAAWSNLGEIGQGDQILMMPTYLRDDLLDMFTFWSIAPGGQYAEVNFANYETRQFRNSLNGGTFGDGFIIVDGRPLPIICYDWHAMSQSAPYFVGDIYILTRQIGNMPVLRGQYIDMAKPANAFAGIATPGHYRATDGGRFLTYWKTDNTCTEATVLMRPNLWISAPWAQARIQNVAALRPLDPISPDPTSSYFVEGHITPATCPEDYLVTSMSS